MMVILMTSFSKGSIRADAKVKLSTKTANLEVGKSKTIKVKGTKKKAKWSIVSGKKIIKISNKKKASVKITGKKAGTAKVQAKIGKKKLVCKITVKKKIKEDENKLPSKATVKVGDPLVLKLDNGGKEVEWSFSEYGYLRRESSDDSKIEMTALNSGTVEVIAEIGKEKQTCKVTVEEKYTYSLVPLMAPFNRYFFLKTDDPEPFDLQFKDESSIYFSGDVDYTDIVPWEQEFFDVQYENADLLRVKGGYICKAGNYLSDGGTLKMQRLLYMDEKGYCECKKGANPEDYVFGKTIFDTTVTIDCQPVQRSIDYLVNTYGSIQGSFFDKLDNIQTNLDRLAIYPRSVRDSSKPNTATPYPFLACLPYEELDLNEHVEMYEYVEGALLTQAMYPFVLDSASFPGTMASAASRLDPTCTIEGGSVHWEIIITKDGVSKSYGGAGGGGYDPILSSMCDKDFKFDGSDSDFATHATPDLLVNKLKVYGTKAYEEAKQYNDLLRGETFNKTIGKGSWIRIGMEPYWVGQAPSKAYAYVTSSLHGSHWYGPVTDAWVDGRYISTHEIYVKGEKFEDHPNATIVLRNQTYTTQNGDSITGDLVYYYYSEDDTWRAYNAYTDAGFYTVGMELPEQFILTREQVSKLNVDQNTDSVPEHGLVYDSSQYPGTPF